MSLFEAKEGTVNILDTLFFGKAEGTGLVEQAAGTNTAGLGVKAVLS